MKTKNQRDLGAGLVFIVVGLLSGIGATRDAVGSPAQPGAGFFPMILSVLLAVLGAVALFKSLTIETEGGEPVGRVAWRPLLFVLAATIVFGATLQVLGLLLAVPLLVLISSCAGDEFSALGVMAHAVVLTLVAWLVFIVLLKLAVPVWPVFITG